VFGALVIAETTTRNPGGGGGEEDEEGQTWALGEAAREGAQRGGDRRGGDGVERHASWWTVLRVEQWGRRPSACG